MAILDLQSNLQSEIQAKESIRKELSTAKAVQVSLEKWAHFMLWLSVKCCDELFPYRTKKLSHLQVDRHNWCLKFYFCFFVLS